ncbi:hypothetical protein DBR32_13710 [Taibaiella sp. KBW10]|uniref:hypothetical protein n=1 Tax=Taibaiella sp. KBW10 TaxID=2153357 RepID=UPI000F592154|nr:hypothetical protein [Taibaiella sp. KBW10]RQO29966.1 hypothetical protein DBR32_13710 [Taibaiella sp. KBW10]
MNLKIPLAVIAGIAIGLTPTFFQNKKDFPGDPKHRRVPYAYADTVKLNIEQYQKLTLLDTTDHTNYQLPHGELHSIESLGSMYEAMDSVRTAIKKEKEFQDKEVYIGVFPSIKEDSLGKRLSFYCIATIGEKGLVDIPGKPVKESSIILYNKLDQSNVNDDIQKSIKSNIYNIGNHYP